MRHYQEIFVSYDCFEQLKLFLYFALQFDILFVYPVFF